VAEVAAVAERPGAALWNAIAWAEGRREAAARG